jgi:hypothetical protein
MMQVENPMVLPNGYGIRDPQSVDRKLVGYCAGCGEGIYEGDEIIELGDEMIHESSSCAYDYCSSIGFHNAAGE